MLTMMSTMQEKLITKKKKKNYAQNLSDSVKFRRELQFVRPHTPDQLNIV